MYSYELADVLLWLKPKGPRPKFPVKNYIAFSSSNTRSGKSMKLVHQSSSSIITHHSYFKMTARLWNSLPPIDLSLSLHTIKTKIKDHMWKHFLNNFSPPDPCSFHFICPCCPNQPIRLQPSCLLWLYLALLWCSRFSMFTVRSTRIHFLHASGLGLNLKSR